MLSKITLVAIKKAIESTFIDSVTIYEKVEEVGEYGETSVINKEILTDVSCRLSYNKNLPTVASETFYKEESTATLFLPPSINIKSGSIYLVTHNGETVKYRQGGEPKEYETHIEIEIIRDKKRS